MNMSTKAIEAKKALDELEQSYEQTEANPPTDPANDVLLADLTAKKSVRDALSAERDRAHALFLKGYSHWVTKKRFLRKPRETFVEETDEATVLRSVLAGIDRRLQPLNLAVWEAEHLYGMSKSVSKAEALRLLDTKIEAARAVYQSALADDFLATSVAA
jgi:hypothetical protein